MSINEENQNPGFLELQDKYRKSIPSKLKTLESLISTLQETSDLKTLTELHFLVHKIAGSSGVYGYMRCSEVAKKFAQVLACMVEQYPLSLKEGRWLKEAQNYMQQIQEAYGEK